MHAAAHDYVARQLAHEHPFTCVVEVGGRDINGGVTHLLRLAEHGWYWSIDLEPGPGVDEVADARAWSPPPQHDPELVLCCEVLEHAPDPAGVVKAMASWLRPGGLLLVTAAGPGRAVHSGHHGGPLAPGEYYGNVDPDDLTRWLEDAGLREVQVHYAPGPCDVYARAVAP